MADIAYLKMLSKQLTDQGKLIEAGWIGLRIAAIPPDAPPAQLEAMHKAFFAGAQHLYASMMTIMDDDAEPTLEDLGRMEKISRELADFSFKLLAEIAPATGRA